MFADPRKQGSVNSVVWTDLQKNRGTSVCCPRDELLDANRQTPVHLFHNVSQEQKQPWGKRQIYLQVRGWQSKALNCTER